MYNPPWEGIDQKMNEALQTLLFHKFIIFQAIMNYATLIAALLNSSMII